MEIKEKVILITGSSSGIGQATALRLAKLGAKVVIHYLKNKEGAESVLKEVTALGSDAMIVQADVSEQEQVSEMFDQVMNKYKTLDVLINNAGQTRGMPFLESTKEHWLEQINTNFIGTVLCSQKAAEIMLKNKSGKILNTSSIRGINHTGREGIMAYSAAKAAVNNFTKTLAKELAPYIQVNAIAPGFVYTPNYDSVDEQLKKDFIASTYINRFMDTDEIAEGYEFLIKSDATTGQIIPIDGGFTLKQG